MAGAKDRKKTRYRFMSSPFPPDRLTDEEMDFVRPGESADVQTWNKQYAFLVDEYRTALAAQDEGWASGATTEVRKCRSGLKGVDRQTIKNIAPGKQPVG